MNEYQDQALWWEVHTFSENWGVWRAIGLTFNSREDAEEFASTLYDNPNDYRIRKVRGLDY